METRIITTKKELLDSKFGEFISLVVPGGKDSRMGLCEDEQLVTRDYIPGCPVDIRTARREGESIIQAFYDGKTGKLGISPFLVIRGVRDVYVPEIIDEGVGPVLFSYESLDKMLKEWGK